MKKEELFEALGGLDDELIAGAKRINAYDEDAVVISRPPLWKTITGFAAAAACLAALVVGGAFGMKYINGLNAVSPNSPGNAVDGASSGAPERAPHAPAAEYPEEARYVFTGDYGGLNYNYCGYKGVGSVSFAPEFFGSYEEMAAASDLIVSGEFTDYSHQTYDPYDENVIADDETPSYNTFRIDKVVKGDKKPGEGIAVKQITHVYRGTTYADWNMSPMICGDKWIYFLVLGEDGYYASVNPRQGRYPLPSGRNKKLNKVSEYGYYGYDDPDYESDPNLETIYADTLEAFGLGVSETTPDNAEVTKVYEYGKSGEEEWTMPEFPGATFRCDGEYVNVITEGNAGVLEHPIGYSLYFGMPIFDVYLVDLNGDGMREIVSTAAIGSGIIDTRVLAFDRANGIGYTLSDRGHYDYTLDNGGGLIVRKYKYNVNELVSEQPLTLDMMTADDSVIVFEGSEPAEWTMDEFPGTTFSADSKALYAERDGVKNAVSDAARILCVRLSDSDGDGKRDIVYEFVDKTGMVQINICYANGSLLNYSGDDVTVDGDVTLPAPDRSCPLMMMEYGGFIDLSGEPDNKDRFEFIYKFTNADEDARVYSTVDGVVVDTDGISLWPDGWGNYVCIRSDDGKYCYYSALGETPCVNAGDRVARGQEIGKVGASGGKWYESDGYGVRYACSDRMRSYGEE